ncbi:MAG: hypothetical protein H6766_01450 [Candidatus Peribacteria bacterium]|nr:MAG: hypothetical protein H6766_01450 [Candidatus Peribacteria bacterium]
MTTLQTNGSETSSGSAIHDHVATLDTDGGQFLWRAYLVSDGNQQAMLDQIDVEDSAFMITFSTGTLLSGTSITDTTITITDLVGISSGSVAIDPSSTAASQLICTQVDPLTVTCTVSVDVSGTLAITATNT